MNRYSFFFRVAFTVSIFLCLIFGCSKTENLPAPEQPSPTPELVSLETVTDIDKLLKMARFEKSDPAIPIGRAIKIYERIIELDPDCYEAFLELGKYYTEPLDRFSDAETQLLNALNVGKKTNDDFKVKEALEHLGRLYTLNGDYEKAEQVLKDSVQGLDELLKKERKYWGCPYQALGELYSKTGRPLEGAKQYMKSADAEHMIANVQFEAAMKTYEAGDLDNATKYIDRAIAIEKNAVWLKVFKGFILLFRKDYKEAESIFNMANSSNPRDPGGPAGLGHLALINKDHKKAERFLTESFQVNRELQDYQDRGFEESQKGNTANQPGDIDPETGVRIVKPIVGHPWYFEYIERMAHLGLSWTYANQNMHQKAMDHYDKILATAPDSLLALIGKGNSLTGLKRLDDAEIIFKDLLKKYPDNEYALAELGLIQLNRGNLGGAEASFKKALAKDNKAYTCPYEGLGLVYLRKGKVGLAKKNLEKAIELNPDIEYKKYNALAKILIKEGKKEKAIKLLKKSVENYPYDTEAAELLSALEDKKKSDAVN